MRVLVTGAGGFVGGHLVRHLLALGHEVFAASTSAVPEEGLEGAAWLPLDLASTASVEEAARAAAPEWVFHLAARSSVGESVEDPLLSWDVNATGTLRLLHALPHGARVVFAGSGQVYGHVPEAEQPIRENRPLRPLNPYAATKAAAEMAVIQLSGAGRVRGVVARSFNLTGPGHDTRFVLPDFARQLVGIRAGEREPVLRVGNLEARRDFLDVRDAVRGYVRLAEAGAPGGVYNLCSGEARRLRDLLDTLVELSGTGARVEVDPARLRPADVPLLVGDRGALAALGWAPEIPIRRTLADLLEDAAKAVPGGAGAPA
jgi:GDP-4-dehydro-6-deoxy-D-mannose reductase